MLRLENLGEDGSVHFLDWPVVDTEWRDEGLGSKWQRLRYYRGLVTEAIEPLRREKVIRSSLEAEIGFSFARCHDLETEPSDELAELFIVSSVRWQQVSAANFAPGGSPPNLVPDHPEGVFYSPDGKIGVTVQPTHRLKCGRCWRHLPEVAQDGALCDRCAGVVKQ
jgi:isoleucyl-tRNA synthetase